MSRPNWISILTVLVVLAFVPALCQNEVWQPKVGCHLYGFTRKVEIPNCSELTVTTNACRGFCESYAVSSNLAIGASRPDQPITSVGQCCNIMDSEETKVLVGCLDGIKEFTFKTATSCSCHHCKKL